MPVGDRVADIVLIGAGHNALISAAYLAAAGLHVVVLEEREVIGGNTITEELTLPGYQHDSCSSAHVLPSPIRWSETTSSDCGRWD